MREGGREKEKKSSENIFLSKLLREKIKREREREREKTF